MLKKLIYALLMISTFWGFAQDKDSQIKVYETFDAFETAFIKNPEKQRVINFWATWCKPCVEELPFFMEWKKGNKNNAIDLVLVSLDRAKDLETRVVPFLKKNNIKAINILLADGKASQWIDRVDSKWSGAIPATLFVKGTKKQFFEKEYHSTEELKQDISAFFDK